MEIIDLIQEARVYHERSQDKMKEWATQYFSHQKNRIVKDVEKICDYVPENGLILDIGSAPFYTDYALHKLHYEVVCLDIAPDRFPGFLEAAGLKAVKCNFELEPIPLTDDSCDLVVLTEVFEHMRI